MPWNEIKLGRGTGGASGGVVAFFLKVVKEGFHEEVTFA